MRIKIAYYGESRSITEKGSEFIDVAHEVHVRDVIGQLAELYGEKMTTLLLNESGMPRRSVLLAVNDVAVDPESSGLLQENDVLAILPAVSGG